MTSVTQSNPTHLSGSKRSPPTLAYSQFKAAQEGIFDKSAWRFSSPAGLANSGNGVTGKRIEHDKHISLWTLYYGISSNVSASLPPRLQVIPPENYNPDAVQDLLP
ncbi:hypothetical protein Q9L58_009704 [Maublancomyces gigas]|uniref:Uncharacterized protein n=1 Tax=Discina gigas TaxID=1032678 RepID=A0ABR3G643_9PEZI